MSETNGAPTAAPWGQTPPLQTRSSRSLSAEPVARSVEPALSFKGTITDASQRPVYLIALTAIVVVEPGSALMRQGSASG